SVSLSAQADTVTAGGLAKARPIGNGFAGSAGSLGEGVSLPPGEYVRVTIIDTGIGMDQITLAKATEPFFTTKGPGKGTGLGLSMVQGLAAQSGGLLRIHSEPNAGTVVELWLPKASTAAAAPVRLPESSPAFRPATDPCTVLIVDDDILVMTGTAAMILDLGHTPIEAHSGAEALQVLSSGLKVD